MPLGQLMLTLTSTTRSVPSSRDRSIRGYWPHSVQNKYLGDEVEVGSAPRTWRKEGLDSVGQGDWARPELEMGLASLSSSLPLLWVDSDGPGLVQTLGDDHIAERAIESGDLDDVKALVRPVDVA